jgi:hypothetical protein
VQVVWVLICVALCADRHMAFRLGAASVVMNELSPRDRGGGRHSPLACVVRKASVGPAQMPYSKSYFRVSD